MRRRTKISLLILLLLSGCGSGDRRGGSTAPIATSQQLSQERVADGSPTTTAAVVPPTTTVSPTSVSTTTTLRPTTTSTTLATIDQTTIDRSGLPSDTPIVFGVSARNEPLTVIRHGDRGGARLLLIGSIHGDEDAGIAIVNELIDRPVPAGVELWLVPTINPDGNALQQRHNANGVDLNRNFPHQWAPLAEPGNWQYAGPSAASESETAAMVMLGVRSDMPIQILPIRSSCSSSKWLRLSSATCSNISLRLTPPYRFANGGLTGAFTAVA